MFILDSLLVSGLRFVLDKVAMVVDQELDDGDRLRERLLETQMQVDLGEISEEDGARLEREILDRLQAIRARREPEPAGEMRLAGVEASLTGDFYEPPSPAGDAPRAPEGRRGRKHPSRRAKKVGRRR